MGNRPDRNAFVLGPAELTTRELERRLDKNNVDVNEVQEQVAAIEPVVTSTVTSGGVFIGIVSTFDDASQLAQVNVGGTIIPMVNYAGRSIGPSNYVACAYLKDDPDTAIIVGVFRGEGYVTPEYTAPVVPQDFPIYGEGLAMPIIGTATGAVGTGSRFWDCDRTNQLGFGTDAIVALGRLILPSPYTIVTDPQSVIVYNKSAGTLNLISIPGAASASVISWGPVIGPSCFFVNNKIGRMVRYNAGSGTFTQLGTNLFNYRIVESQAARWAVEHQTGTFNAWVTQLPETGDGTQLPSRRIQLLDLFSRNEQLHITAGGGVIWVCDGTSTGAINYMHADLTSPSVQRFGSELWGGGRLATIENSGADGDGDLEVIVAGETNYNILCIAASFDGLFNAEAFQNVFDPNVLPVEVHEMIASGSSGKSMYVAGIVLAEAIDEAYADSGMVMPAIWETNLSSGTPSSALIWTGVNHVAPYAHCHGLNLDGPAGKLSWMVVVAPLGIVSGAPKQTYIYDSDV